MNYIVYVLESGKNGLRYIGYTQNLANRLKEHNSGGNVSTRSKGPWKLLCSEEQPTKSLAEKRERFFKSGHGRAVLKNLIGA
ncbi:MAG: GIY-YIG nuclease family protein [Candidatus Omnitrophica bacterium]|nr:GIY-YIG nuclease family protein [Candidatus Omnitrophota bacterium]